MLTIPPRSRIFLAVGPTDMRKSFDGLQGAVRSVIERDPLSGHFFVFCNRRRDRLKVLHGDAAQLRIEPRQPAGVRSVVVLPATPPVAPEEIAP